MKLWQRIRRLFSRGPVTPNGVRFQPLGDIEVATAFGEGRCPDCGQTEGFLEGPSGGLSTNWKCHECGSKFNISIMSFGASIPAIHAERI